MLLQLLLELLELLLELLYSKGETLFLANQIFPRKGLMLTTYAIIKLSSVKLFVKKVGLFFIVLFNLNKQSNYNHSFILMYVLNCLLKN